MKLKLFATTFALSILCGQTFAAPVLAYLKRVTPAYPVIAARLGMYGDVQVAVVIAEDGSVESASIEKSSGYRELDEAALSAAKSSTFVPIRDESGKAFRAQVVAPFSFVAPDENMAPALVPAKSSEQYADFLTTALPSIRCSEVIREARRFQRAMPSASFKEMTLFQATNELLAKRSAQKAMSPYQYSNALLACTKDATLTYMNIVNELLQ